MLGRLAQLFSKRVEQFDAYRKAVAGKRGLEIGGPSGIFGRGGDVPIYPAIAALDACNFAENTLWRDGIAAGDTFEFAPDKPKGRQYVCEASDLSVIPTGTYDFVAASHVIEHLANPLKGLAEWIRVTKEGAPMVLVVPHLDGTFDRHRSVTRFEHLLDDLERDVGEDDQTHLEEWLANCDLSRAPEAGSFEKFRERSLRNLENRGMHHHVFDTELVVRVLDHAGLQIVSIGHAQPFHIVALARRVSSNEKPDNGAFVGPNARWRRTSPFASDRRRVA